MNNLKTLFMLLSRSSVVILGNFNSKFGFFKYTNTDIFKYHYVDHWYFSKTKEKQGEIHLIDMSGEALILNKETLLPLRIKHIKP